MKYYVVKETTTHVPLTGKMAGQKCTLTSYVRGYVMNQKVYFIESTLLINDAIKLTYQQALRLAKSKDSFQIIPAP